MTSDDATELLTAYVLGKGDAEHRLTSMLYQRLRALAGHFLGREREEHTLSPTALVHEAYLKLIEQGRTDWKGRAHFLALAGKIMRRVLVDHARARGARKRGGHLDRVDLGEVTVVVADQPVDILQLEESLKKLTERSPREARVIELRVFGGLTVKETAEALRVSTGTVDGDWAMARAWLLREVQHQRGET